MSKKWILILAAGLATMASVPVARADAAFDACVEQLCVSPDQMNCWVKAGAELCADDGSCSDLEDHAGARILDKTGKKWKVETQYGTGWVNNRYMMVDSSFCPGL